MQDHMVELYKTDPAAAQRELTDFSQQATHKVCDAWENLYVYLLVKYNDGNVKKEENGRFLTTKTEIPQCVSPDQPAYPDKWYKMIVNDCGDNILNKLGK